MPITNVILATLSKGMQVVLNQPHAEQAGQCADFVWMTLNLAKQQNYTNNCSSQVSIWVVSRVLASHISSRKFYSSKSY